MSTQAQAPFPKKQSHGREMELRWHAKQRAAHYEDQADKLRRLAEAEPIDGIRTQLLAVAKLYQELAVSLREDRSAKPF